MGWFARSVGRTSCAAALGALIFAAPAQAAQADRIAPAARAAWGFDRSDLAPHSGVRFRVLSNGMRYALMRNAEPAGALSVRFHIDAGSAVEGEEEHGFMHLIEHLAFEGTANISALGLPLMLSRDGLRRWTDFNAFTSYDETLYRLDLARSDPRARGTALTLMREIASNLAFERRAVEGAKDMVRTEIGERDALEDRLTVAQNAFFFPGSAIARSSVAGTEANVKRASGAALRRLYGLHYVPQRTTLILAGDFDPAMVEAEIAARFSDWPAGTGKPVDPPAVPMPDRDTETRLFVDHAAPTSVTIAATRPLAGADAARRRDFQFLEHLGSEMLNRRMARLAARPNAPFAASESAIYDHFSTGRLARVEVTAKGREWEQALRAGQRELRQALETGFSQAEFDEQLAASGSALGKTAAPRTSSELADAIADAVGRGIIFTQPGDGSATSAYLAGLRLEDVNDAFKAAWAGRQRLIFVSHHRPIRDAEAAILAVWNAGLR